MRAGATIALMVYAGGAIMALIAGYRGLRLVEAMSLIAVPFLFNLLLTIGADWHMAEIGAARDRARQSAVSSPGRDRTSACLVVHRRGDADADQSNQRQPAAALGRERTGFLP